MRKLPAIISDIDGVLVRGSKLIGNSDKVLNYIRSPLSHIFKNNETSKIPFLCLTNGGGKLEYEKADQLNKLLEFTQKSPGYLQGSNILLNFSPLRPIIKNFQNHPVLIIGSGDIARIAVSMGLN